MRKTGGRSKLLHDDASASAGKAKATAEKERKAIRQGIREKWATRCTRIFPEMMKGYTLMHTNCVHSCVNSKLRVAKNSSKL